MHNNATIRTVGGARVRDGGVEIRGGGGGERRKQKEEKEQENAEDKNSDSTDSALFLLEYHATKKKAIY